MDHRSTPETSPFTLALYGTAVAVALGAAAVASTAAFSPQPTSEAMLVAANAPPPRAPDRIIGLIEPAAPALAAVAAKPVTAAAATSPPHPATTPAAGTKLATIPPKPLPRPCIECTLERPPAAAAALARSADPVGDSFDIASVTEDTGPLPPLPVGGQAGEGGRPGLLRRGGQAVVSGGSQLVGSAWTLSGQAVGGMVRGVRQLTF